MRTLEKFYQSKSIKNPLSPTLISVWEEGEHVPFAVKRVYYISEVPIGEIRGHHAHKTLEQILICPSGSIKVSLDNGFSTFSTVLNSPNKGLYVGPSVWRTMEWLTKNSLLLVLASAPYTEKDYIRSYEDFLTFIQKEHD